MKVYAMVLVVSALLGGLSGCQLFDNGPKTAVINTRDVLTKCNDGLRVVEEIQKQFSYRQEQLKAQDESLQKRRLDPALSDPKSGKKDELQALVQQFLEDSQKLRKDVGDVEAVKFKPVVDKINKALAGYAKAHGLVSVQDKNGFAYIDPSIDITEVIIKQVDQVP